MSISRIPLAGADLVDPDMHMKILDFHHNWEHGRYEHKEETVRLNDRNKHTRTSGHAERERARARARERDRQTDRQTESE